MHQIIAGVQLMTESCINHYTARLIYNTLKINNFVEAGVQSKHTSTNQKLKEALTSMLTTKESSTRMMDKFIILEVTYGSPKNDQVVQLTLRAT